MSVDQKFLLWRGTIGSLLSNNYLYLLLSLSSVLVLWPMMQPLSVWAGVLEGMLILTLGFCIFAASRRPGGGGASIRRGAGRLTCGLFGPAVRHIF